MIKYLKTIDVMDDMNSKHTLPYQAQRYMHTDMKFQLFCCEMIKATHQLYMAATHVHTHT